MKPISNEAAERSWEREAWDNWYTDESPDDAAEENAQIRSEIDGGVR